MTSTTLPISLSEKSFQQKDEAKKIIKRNTLYAAGLGFFPIPILDAVSITGIQIWMIRDIAKVYDVPFKRHIVKSFIGAAAGNLGAIGIVKFIPGIGSMLGGTTVSVGAATATYALGQLFMEHFSQGGTLLDFDPVKSRAYFQKLYEEHETTVNSLKNKEQVAQSPTETSLAEMQAYLKERELYFQEQHEKDAQTIADLQATNQALTTDGVASNQQENEERIVQLKADNLRLQATNQALTTDGVASDQQENEERIVQLEADNLTLQETIDELQEKIHEQDADYFKNQEGDRAEIIALIAANKARQHEIVAVQQQLKGKAALEEELTIRYETSQTEQKQLIADLKQQVQSKETLEDQLAQAHIREQQHKRQVQQLETTAQQGQRTITTLQQQLQEKEAAQKRNKFWWLLLPLLLLLGWFAGLSYGKRTSTKATPQEQVQPLGFKATTNEPPTNIPTSEAVATAATALVPTELSETTAIKVSEEESSLRGPDAAALGFDPDSAEAAMANHLCNPAAIYPKTFWAKKIYFLPTADQPHPSSQQQIENIVLVAKKYPQMTMRIYGHTDKTEGFPAGINRANIIANILKDKGIAANRIVTYLIDKKQEAAAYRGIEFELLSS